jgi:hypothetical protein
VIINKQRNPDDIQIEHRKWIELQSPQSGLDDALNIDRFVDRIPAFWKDLETECMAECCGIAAFSFWQEDIDRALGKGSTGVAETIEDLRFFVAENDGKVFVSSRLNQYFPHQTLIELLDHISAAIKNHNGEQAVSGNRR